MLRFTLTLLILMPLLIADVVPAESSKDEQVYKAQSRGVSEGIESIALQSDYQKGAPVLRILQPTKQNNKADKQRRILFVLPVVAGLSKQWGDGLLHIKQLDLHNKHHLIVIAPSFSHLPWYADHPTNKQIQQETFLIKAVLPYVLKRFPTKPADRLLLGFSKSGWGAYTVLLRNPKLFGAAAAWDAPLMKAKPNQFGMGPIFGTQENFQHYHLSKLFENTDATFKQSTRLVLTGYDNFRPHHLEVHAAMKKLGVKHIYKDGPKRKHHWESGWVAETVKALLELE